MPDRGVILSGGSVLGAEFSVLFSLVLQRWVGRCTSSHFSHWTRPDVGPSPKFGKSNFHSYHVRAVSLLLKLGSVVRLPGK